MRVFIARVYGAQPGTLTANILSYATEGSGEYEGCGEEVRIECLENQLQRGTKMKPAL